MIFLTFHTSPDGLLGGMGTYESYIVWHCTEFLYPRPDPDLHGYRIDSLSLRRDSLAITPDGGGSGNDTFAYKYTCWADGEPLPEPAAASPWAALASALLVRRQPGRCGGTRIPHRPPILG